MMNITWNPDDHLVVAVSTGIDSMVLLYRLLHHYPSTYRQLTVLHVHHGVRQSSDEEAQFLKRYCEAHQVAVHVHLLDLSTTLQAQRSIQNEARQARYAWFDSMMHQLQADVLLTAHHFDDQMETIFYRVFTGKVLRSTLGIEACEQRKGYRLVRPMLEETKSDIQTFQQAHQVPYFEDESNQDTKYVRNAIRNEILPLIESNAQFKTEHLNKLYEMHKASLAHFETITQTYIETQVTEHAKGYEMSIASFLKCPEHVRMIILDKLIQKWDAFARISDAQYQDWFAKMARHVAQLELYTTNTWRINIVYDKLTISAAIQKTQPTPIQIDAPGCYIFGDYQIELNALADVHLPIHIRPRETGDRVTLHQHGHKKISRLMIDAKVPQEERNRIPVIVDAKGEILAVGELYQFKTYKHLINIAYLGDEGNEK